MDTEKILKLLELIGEVVSAEGKTWKEKRAMVLAEASDDDKTNIVEFAWWFDEGTAE